METFTKEELRDIAVSIAVLILIFSWKPFPHFGLDYAKIPLLSSIVVVAFLLHEMAHKFVAKKFGISAHYKMWPPGLLFGMMFMFIGLKLVAPGAVVISPFKFARWGYRRNVPEMASGETGLIALAGPATNILLALVFTLFDGGFFHAMTQINAWLAFFNLIPLKQLDGGKVLIWKPWVWGMSIALALILYFV